MINLNEPELIRDIAHLNNDRSFRNNDQAFVNIVAKLRDEFQRITKMNMTVTDDTIYKQNQGALQVLDDFLELVDEAEELERKRREKEMREKSHFANSESDFG